MRQFKWAKIDTRYPMQREEWIFVGVTVWACIVAFGVGLVLGQIWVLLI